MNNYDFREKILRKMECISMQSINSIRQRISEAFPRAPRVTGVVIEAKYEVIIIHTLVDCFNFQETAGIRKGSFFTLKITNTDIFNRVLN